MSNVNVNGNIYNNVESIQLMKADGSGYAKYTEGSEAADSMLDTLLSGDSLGDIQRDDSKPCIEWLSGRTFGTVSFPYATSVNGACERVTAENILLPNVSTFNAVSTGNNGWRSYGFINCKITGVLDLSSLDTVLNNATSFKYSVIGTLKLGSYAPGANIWGSVVVTNLVWYGLTSDRFSNSTFQSYFKNATVTNLYVPADLVDTVNEKITDGTLTKVANVYSIDDWED